MQTPDVVKVYVFDVVRLRSLRADGADAGAARFVTGHVGDVDVGTVSLDGNTVLFRAEYAWSARVYR